MPGVGSHGGRTRCTGSVAPPRPALAEYAGEWLAARRDQITGPARYRVIIVATAGGGIRSAY